MAKILIIDDDDAVRDSLEAVISAAGYTVRTASNGHVGLVEYTAFQPDVVVTDMMMPEQDGLQTILELRRRDPNLPIIAMSGGGRVGDLTFLGAAHRFGADDTISKPFTGSYLLARIDHLLPATINRSLDTEIALP